MEPLASIGAAGEPLHGKTTTFPITALKGTGPKLRLSSDAARLSPITYTVPPDFAGMCCYRDHLVHFAQYLASVHASDFYAGVELYRGRPSDGWPTGAHRAGARGSGGRPLSPGPDLRARLQERR